MGGESGGGGVGAEEGGGGGGDVEGGFEQGATGPALTERATSIAGSGRWYGRHPGALVTTHGVRRARIRALMRADPPTDLIELPRRDT